MLLIKNIGTLATPLGTSSRCGSDQGKIEVLHNAAVLIDGEKIAAVTANGELPEYSAYADIIDAHGALATPGLVDAHTHLVFGGWRAHEVPLKIAGASYLDILNAGGGILNTLTNTRKATEDELFERGRGFLAEMLDFGVTTVEIKSGYGLDSENELKQLRVIRRLGGACAQDIAATFLGAHAIPDEYAGNADGYIDFIIERVLPVVTEQGLAYFCDVFLESSVFNVPQSRKLLLAAQKLGLPSKVHADEIDPLGGSELAGEIGAISAEHLIATRDSGIEAMAKAKTTACLLPQTSLYLNKPFARARDMISAGVPVAIATDFNPGSCPSLNLQLSMNLGYLRYRLFPEEVLTAVTLNAACAIGKGDSVGSIEPGKLADIVLWNADELPMLCYRMGSNQVKKVIKRGRVAVK